jgi:hypothetical protein
MRLPIFALAPLVAGVLALGVASAGAANQFAVGSAKTDLASLASAPRSNTRPSAPTARALAARPKDTWSTRGSSAAT